MNTFLDILLYVTIFIVLLSYYLYFRVLFFSKTALIITVKTLLIFSIVPLFSPFVLILSMIRRIIDFILVKITKNENASVGYYYQLFLNYPIFKPNGSTYQYQKNEGQNPSESEKQKSENTDSSNRFETEKREATV